MRGMKGWESRSIIRQKKDLFSWKLYYRPSLQGTWQAPLHAPFSANLSVRGVGRGGSSLGCNGGRGKLDVQRHWGAFRNLPRTFRSAKMHGNVLQHRNIFAAVSSDLHSQKLSTERIRFRLHREISVCEVDRIYFRYLLIATLVVLNGMRVFLLFCRDFVSLKETLFLCTRLTERGNVVYNASVFCKSVIYEA